MVNFAENLEGKEVVFVLIGTYEHNIDGKNRLFVPAKFRAVLGNEFIFKICRSKYPSVQLYSRDQFRKEVDEALKGVTAEVLKRNIKAQKYLGTGEAVCDAQGRIVLGGETAKLAKLEKACILTGFGDYVEIMSPEVYEAYNTSLLEAAMAEEEAFFAQEEIRNEKRSEGAYLDTDNKTEE